MFEFKENKIILDPNVLSLPWFKEIWDKDKTKTKEEAIQTLTYIFYLVDYKSPYYHLSEVQRRENIIKDLMGGKYRETKEVITAIEKYKEFTRTLSSELLESVKNLMYNMRKYYDTIAFDTSKDSDIELEMKKADSIQKSIASIGKTLDSLQSLEERVKKEKSADNRVMGGHKLGLFSE